MCTARWKMLPDWGVGSISGLGALLIVSGTIMVSLFFVNATVLTLSCFPEEIFLALTIPQGHPVYHKDIVRYIQKAPLPVWQKQLVWVAYPSNSVLY